MRSQLITITPTLTNHRWRGKQSFLSIIDRQAFDHNRVLLLELPFLLHMHWQCSSLLMNYWLRHTLPVLQFSIIGMSDLLPVFPKHDKPTGQTLKLYEQIVIKNFQILKTILPKMNSLYQLNEQLQRSVSTIETRLVKMESDQENLHYEMRTSHLAIDSKLNSIILEYNNISNETNKVKKQTEMLTREIREAKSKHFIERSQKSQVEMPPEPIMHKEKNNEKVKKIAFAEKDQVFPSLFKNKSKTTQKNRRSSISLDKEDSPGKAQRVNFNIPPQNESLSEKRIAEQASENKISQPVESSRKTTFKSNKSSLHPSPAKSLREIKTSKSIQPINPADSKSFERFLKEIENYHFHNQKMKQNYEQLMQEYEKANQASFAQLNQKVNTLSFKLNELDPQGKLYDSIKNIINAEFGPKIDTITAAIEQKIDRRIFQKIMTDFNTRILGIHQQRKKTANRDQTKRALEFLQKKINGVLNDYYQAKQKSVHHVSVDKRGCLRTAGLLDEREPKDYNRDHLTQSQTATNTPRALRNDSSRTTKKQPASMHSRILNGTLTENRFNESEWKPIITEKGEVQEEAFTRRPSNNKKANLLKKKAYQLLDKEKGKDRPKLKKQRLIFQYD